MTMRFALLFVGLAGCIDPFAAYEDPVVDASDYDPHEPASLARTLLMAPATVAYSDDGERFALHRCKEWRDKSVTCELAFGTRDGLNELWPVSVPAASLDGDGARKIVGVLASRLDDIDAHLMEDVQEGTTAIVSAAKGGHRVTLDERIVRLGYVTANNSPTEQRLAAIEIEGGTLSKSVRVYGSFRRRDAVIVELWHEVAEGPVARYNAFVLFFRREDGRWVTRFVRPVGPEVLSDKAVAPRGVTIAR